MATKTISIDTEAYARLKGAQKENESFGQVIKRVIWQPAAFEKMLEQRKKDPLGEDAAKVIEKVVKQRNIFVKRSRQRSR